MTRKDKNIFCCSIVLVSSIACQITADCSKQNFKKESAKYEFSSACVNKIHATGGHFSLSVWLKCETNSFPYGSTFHTFELANRILEEQTYILHKAFFSKPYLVFTLPCSKNKRNINKYIELCEYNLNHK